MNKRKTIIMTLLTFILCFLGITVNSHVSYAKEIPVEGSNNPVVTTMSGQNVTNQNLDRWQTYNVDYNWSLPNGTNIISGDTASFTIPSNINIIRDMSFPVKNDDGDVVGTFNVSKGASVGTLTFNDYYEKHQKIDIHGTLHFTGTGKENVSVKDWVLNKAGWLDGNNIPTWTIVYNPTSQSLTNVTITDTLQGEQKFILGSFYIQLGTVDENNNFIIERQYPDAMEYIKINGNEFTAHFDKLDKAIRIVYQTEPTTDGFLNLTNVANASSDQLGNSSVGASIQVDGSGTAGGIVPGTPEGTTTPEESTTTPEGTTTPEESTTTPEGTTTPEESTTTPEGTTTPEHSKKGIVINKNNSDSNKKGSQNNISKTTDTDNNLPQTSNKKNIILSIVGIILILGVIIFGIMYFKKHKNK